MIASLLAALALPLGLLAPWRRVATGLGLLAILAFILLLGAPPMVFFSFLAALPAFGVFLALSAFIRYSLEQTERYTGNHLHEEEQVTAHHDRRLAAYRMRIERIRAQTISFDRLNRVAARYGTPNSSAAVEAITIDGAREILGGGMVRIEPLAAHEPDPLPSRTSGQHRRSAISVPIITTGPHAVRRRLVVEDEREWTTMDLRMLFSLAETAALAYEIAGLAEIADYEARHDALTGLFLRRAFETEVEIRLSLAQRARRSCAFAMIDFDRFKSLNDTFGHAAGDEALRGFGRHAGAFFEALTQKYSLLVGRVGGEEFAVFAEDVTPTELAATIDQLRQEVAAACRRPDGTSLTFSAGVSGYPGDAEDYKSLAELADKALYHAKASGRNRVEVFTR